MSDRWRSDTWNQGDGWPTTTVRCVLCGEHRIAFEPHLYKIGAWKREHEATCPEPPVRRCPAFMFTDAGPNYQCILAAGHPVGSYFDWFTDYLGHIWEKP